LLVKENFDNEKKRNGFFFLCPVKKNWVKRENLGEKGLSSINIEDPPLNLTVLFIFMVSFRGKN